MLWSPAELLDIDERCHMKGVCNNARAEIFRAPRKYWLSHCRKHPSEFLCPLHSLIARYTSVKPHRRRAQ